MQRSFYREQLGNKLVLKLGNGIDEIVHQFDQDMKFVIDASKKTLTIKVKDKIDQRKETRKRIINLIRDSNESDAKFEKFVKGINELPPDQLFEDIYIYFKYTCYCDICSYDDNYRPRAANYICDMFGIPTHINKFLKIACSCAKDIELIDKLISMGGDVNYEKKKKSCLMNCWSVHVLNHLINRGADVNYTDYTGSTALTYHANNIKKVKILMDNGASINHENNKGIIPLTQIYDDFEIYDKLIAHGADVDYVNKNGDTPAIIAASDKNNSLLKCLIRNEAELNHVNNSGNTALMMAVIRADLKSVIDLYKAGADTTIKTKKGETILELSKKFKKRKEIYDFFKGMHLIGELYNYKKRINY